MPVPLPPVLNVWVPWTHLAPETQGFAQMIGAHLAQVEPTEGYARFMAERWREGAAFVVVEHDVVPTVGQVAEIWACPEPLCCYGYEGEDRRTLLFGCVKFSSGLIARTAPIWADFIAAEDAPEGHPHHDFSAARCRRWMMLPEWFDHWFAPAVYPFHWHGRVRHLALSAGSR